MMTALLLCYLAAIVQLFGAYVARFTALLGVRAYRLTPGLGHTATMDIWPISRRRRVMLDTGIFHPRSLMMGHVKEQLPFVPKQEVGAVFALC